MTIHEQDKQGYRVLYSCPEYKW